MAIYGSIEEAGLPDVLQLLALGRRTGCLSVVDGEMHGEIYLAAGRIAYATVSGRAERFGDVLVKNGLITREQLQRAVEEQSRGPQRQLGRILVDSGQIDRADLDRFVRRQVEESVYYLFARKQGEFSFVTDKRTSHQALLEPLDAESLLLEGARRVDEWGQVQRKIPSFDLVYRPTKDTHSAAVAAELTEPQRRILPLLDGGRDVNAVVEATGMDEFEVGKALYGLIMAGFVQLVERRAAVRHLDYRELLAWVVREAEFADPQRRKDAGRHIVDCPTCAERLRRIQVRRTEGSAAVPVLAVAAAAAGGGGGGGARVSQGGMRVESAPPFAPTASAARSERRHGERRVRERRTGGDRRQGDRRAGYDRRRGGDEAWARSHVERRVGPRREDERRPSRGDRRGGNGDFRVVEPPVAVPAAQRPEPGERRITEPRFAPQVEADDAGERPLRVEVPETREHEAVAPAAELSPAGPEGAPAPQDAPPEGRPGRSRDIEWIVSPSESDDMLRASRAARRDATGSAGSETHREPLPALQMTAGAAAAAQGLRPPGHLTWGGAEPRSRRAATEPFLGVDWRGIPWRPFGAAAAILGIALIGYGVGKVVKPGGAHRPAETAAAPSQPAEAAPLRAVPPQQVATVSATPPRTTPEAAPRTAPPREPPAQPPARAAAEPPAPRPAPPTVGVVRGVVRGPGGAAVPGARVGVRGTALAAVADLSGAFELRDVPDGDVALIASAEGYLPDTVSTRARAGAAVAADLSLARPAPPPAPAAPAPTPTVTAAEPDRELAEGGWNVVSRAEALSALGGTFGAIRGLPIESVAKSTAGTRTRVRVAQLTESGQRIVLLETRAGAAVRGGEGPAAVTALRVLPASEAYPFATGTASFGNILITAKSTVPAETLRSLLGRLSEVAP